MAGLNATQYLKTGSMSPQKLDPSTGGRYTRTTFRALGNFTTAVGYGAPTGATGAINNWDLPVDIGGQCYGQYFILGAGQTILAPAFDVTTSLGVDISLDQTDNEGAEYIFGARDGTATTGLRGKHEYVIGTDKAFFAQWKLSIADASGTDEMLFGWRRTQAFQTAHTGYTDYAYMGLLTLANPGLIQTKTRLNSGSASTVSSTATWADGATKTLRVEVLQNGKVRFILNGAMLGNQTSGLTGQAFTFDAGDTVLPSLFFLHSSDVAGTVLLQEFECGYIEKRLF